jgi:hypothetical protein
MTAAASFLPTALPPDASAGGFARWLRSRPGTAAVAGLLAFAGPLTFFTGALSVLRVPSGESIARLALWWTAYGAVLWGLLLLVGYCCERLASRHRRVVGAVIWFSGVALVAAGVSLATAGRAGILLEQGLVQSARAMHLHGFIFSLIMAWLFFAHLGRSRRHQQASARLSAAQAAQRHARNRIVQARLQEVQARIDPQVLFEMLEAARQLYQRDAQQAERLLDELIAFLRAALPRLRTPSSTLLREVDLARAYVRLHALAGEFEMEMTVDIAPDTIHARFPAGVLLPLLSPAYSGACRLRAWRSGDLCQVALIVGTAPSAAAIARVRSLLIELEPAGELALETASQRAGAGDVQVMVTVPYELA